MGDALTRSMRASHVLVALLVAGSLAFAAIGVAINDTFYLRLATEALIFAGLALSVDILLGYTGLLSLGQALFFGLGAYLSALVLMVVPSFWAAFGATAAASGLAGLVGGFIVQRVRGVYFALITFGMAQVAAKVDLQHPRARRVRWIDRRSHHRHQPRHRIAFERLARPAFSCSCSRSSSSFMRSRPICSTRRLAGC